jgi:2-C-methyl-D-erythritol 4-phosphate cytidylyltransferase
MTKRATATKAQIKRCIEAALEQGLHIAGIRPDGTIVTYDGGENPLVPIDGNEGDLAPSDVSRWAD